MEIKIENKLFCSNIVYYGLSSFQTSYFSYFIPCTLFTDWCLVAKQLEKFRKKYYWGKIDHNENGGNCSCNFFSYKMIKYFWLKHKNTYYGGVEP